MDSIVSKGSVLRNSMLLEGAAILIDKPLDWTSFDVVNKLRFAFKHHLGIKKYKVGHAGTLDPLASGLLIICISRYTKKIDEFMSFEKQYEAVLQLGASTPTYDAESLPDIYYPSLTLTDKMLEEVQRQFTGDLLQIPPMYSAIKIKGTPLYKLARRGEKIQLEPRPVHIPELIIQKKSTNQLLMKVTCSKGTYIRSLAFDIGRKLGTGAYLKELRRTAIGPFTVENALTIDDCLSQLSQLK